MSSDIRNTILIKLYNRFFENFVLGFSKNGLEDEFPNNNSNEVRMILNELSDNFLISFTSNSYKITVFGIKFVEQGELVDATLHKLQRNKVIECLKKYGNAWSVGRRFYKQICQYWKQFLISIVESKLYFFKIQMKILFWYSTIIIQPGFGITPKSFHSIDVSIISDILIFTMKNNFVFSSHAK